MRRTKTAILLMLAILLTICSMIVAVGCKEKKVEIAKAELVETPVKRLYVPFADESTEITGRFDDYLLEEPLEPSDEEAEDDPNTYPEEEPDEEPREPGDEPEGPDDEPEDPGDEPEEDPNDWPEEEPNEYPEEPNDEPNFPEEEPNDWPEEEPNDDWF